MIDAVPHTEYVLGFHDTDPMPLYMYYCLLGQDYEVFRNEPHLLTDRGENAERVLDTFHILLNGYPDQDDCRYYDKNIRVFNTRHGGDGEDKIARACFYFEDNVLYCNIQRGHYGKDHIDTRKHIEYEHGYKCSWDLDTLDWYGIVKVAEEEFDD